MRREKRRLLADLLGFLCALILGGVFYAVMVYQLAGEEPAEKKTARFVQNMPFPAMTLEGGTLISEEQKVVRMGGADCRTLTRVYAFEDGSQCQLISAAPAAYLERLALEGWTPQLITGFVMDDLEAVYALRGDRAVLAAQNGDFVYMIEAAADEQKLYALGTQARIENPAP